MTLAHLIEMDLGMSYALSGAATTVAALVSFEIMTGEDMPPN